MIQNGSALHQHKQHQEHTRNNSPGEGSSGEWISGDVPSKSGRWGKKTWFLWRVREPDQVAVPLTTLPLTFPLLHQTVFSFLIPSLQVLLPTIR